MNYDGGYDAIMKRRSTPEKFKNYLRHQTKEARKLARKVLIEKGLPPERADSMKMRPTKVGVKRKRCRWI